MKNLTLKNLAEACGGELRNYSNEYDNREADSVVIDSRLVTEGGIFIATKGERVDGHSFIEQVFSKGALGVVCEKEQPQCLKPYILVKDSFKALSDIAAYYREQLTIPVIGITGSVGKTSTKEFIAGTLAAKFKVLKTQGNLNNEIGMPLTLLSIRDEHEIAVVEMGISHFGEMSRMAKIAKPDTCVITNIGQCHLEFLKDRDGVLRAKTEMFESLNPKGAVFLNGDDDKLRTLKSPVEKPIRFFGMNDGNDIYPSEIVNKGLLGSKASIHIRTASGNGEFEDFFDADVPLPGIHMIYNAMAATGVGLEYGMTYEEIKKGIASVKAVSGRSNIISTNDYTLIDDCYNANPVSMKAAIDLLNLANTRKVAILGDMYELGENEKALHKEVGDYAKENGIDVLISIGELSRNMICADYHFDTKEEFLDLKDTILQKGDSILIKASHGMHLEEILGALQ